MHNASPLMSKGFSKHWGRTCCPCSEQLIMPCEYAYVLITGSFTHNYKPILHHSMMNKKYIHTFQIQYYSIMAVYFNSEK